MDASKSANDESTGPVAPNGGAASEQAEGESTANVTVRNGATPGQGADAAPSGAGAHRLETGQLQHSGNPASSAQQNADAHRQPAQQSAAQLDAAPRDANLQSAVQSTAASQQRDAQATPTRVNAAQQHAAGHPGHQNAVAQTTRVDSTNGTGQSANPTTTLNTDSARNAADHNAGQQSQQQSGRGDGGGATQQLKQQVMHAVQQPGGHGTEDTAAVRRSEQVNVQVQAENVTGTRAVSVESLSSQTPVNAGHASHPAVDLGATARANAQPVMTPSGQPVDEPQLTSNVVRGMSALVNQRGGVMHMRLEPPELGQLRVQMTIARGTVTAQFHAATAQAQQVLERNMTALRTALERHGLSVEKITVQTQPPAQSNSTSGQQLNHQNADQSGQNNQHDAGDGQSRGRGNQHGDESNARQGRHDQAFDNYFAQQHEQSFADAVDTTSAAAGVAS